MVISYIDWKKIIGPDDKGNGPCEGVRPNICWKWAS